MSNSWLAGRMSCLWFRPCVIWPLLNCPNFISCCLSQDHWPPLGEVHPNRGPCFSVLPPPCSSLLAWYAPLHFFTRATLPFYLRVSTFPFNLLSLSLWFISSKVIATCNQASGRLYLHCLPPPGSKSAHSTAYTCLLPGAWLLIAEWINPVMANALSPLEVLSSQC